MENEVESIVLQKKNILNNNLKTIIFLFDKDVKSWMYCIMNQ